MLKVQVLTLIAQLSTLTIVVSMWLHEVLTLKLQLLMKNDVQ